MRLFSKTKAAVLLTATVALTASAQFNLPQNARVNALAGAHVSDISGIYKYPVMMTGYADHVQATWNGVNGSGFIGIKSVTDMFSFGVLANQGPMDPAFTDAAVAALNGYFANPLLGAAAPRRANEDLFDNTVVVPHLLLGFDLGAIALGADVFLEYGGYSGEIDDTTIYSGSLTNLGARLSGKLNFGDAWVMAKLGFGLPSINAEGPAGTDKRTSDKGLYMEMGAEADIPVGAFDLVAGLDYTQASYRFKLGTVSDPNLYTNSLIRAHLGVEFNFVETAVAALGYELNRRAVTTSQPDVSGEPSQTEPDYYHALYAGVENAWENAWIFDSFQLRGGALYTISSQSGYTKIPAPARNPNYSMPGRHSAIQPSIGVGVTKAFATIDVSLNPGAWGGFFTGPDVAMVSATVKF